MDNETTPCGVEADKSKKSWIWIEIMSNIKKQYIIYNTMWYEFSTEYFLIANIEKKIKELLTIGWQLSSSFNLDSLDLNFSLISSTFSALAEDDIVASREQKSNFEYKDLLDFVLINFAMDCRIEVKSNGFLKSCLRSKTEKNYIKLLWLPSVSVYLWTNPDPIKK